MAQVPQVRRVLFRDEEIGMGFDSASGLAVGSPFADVDGVVDEDAPGQRVSSSISIINSHEELMDELGMSFEAQGRYGFFQASAKADFADSTSYNSTSTFVVARCIVSNPFKRAREFTLTESARNLLDRQDFDTFTRAFGDSFVRGLQTGGEFYTVIRITSVDVAKQTELAITLQAEYNGLAAAGEFKGAFSKASASASSRSELEATMYQQAGSGATIAPITSIEELIPRFRDFPKIVLDSAVAFETEVATYDTLPLPLPTPEEQENFTFALRSTREAKLRYIQARNDLEFARRNRAFFADVPPDAELAAAIGTYTKLINASMDHADRLSRGEVKPPSTFDPGSLQPPVVEPAPVTLTRVSPPVARTIAVPDFGGVTTDEIDEVAQAASFSTLEAVVAGTAFGPEGEVNHARLRPDLIPFVWKSLHEGPRLKRELLPAAHPAEVNTWMICRSQFPAPGGLVALTEEVILQFVEEPVPG